VNTRGTANACAAESFRAAAGAGGSMTAVAFGDSPATFFRRFLFMGGAHAYYTLLTPGTSGAYNRDAWERERFCVFLHW
jgi:hypothetical protein